MRLNDIFAKDVQRPIEGVVKADDAVHLATEVEEYVLTNEAAKGLELLLEAYTNYTNANGVWISGFFGSGKSHLLKMLAHLLGDVEAQALDRSGISETFASKANDAFLPPLLEKAARIPAKSLLFNVDQKATLIAKDQSDALLRVFVKVFDESCGYYGNQGHVARFERDLDKRGQYDAFKAAYERIAERPWVQGREEGVLEEANVAKAYAEISGQSADSPTQILTKYRNEYAVSIEDFADEVRAWLDGQEADYRLNFFVDEVGQFIGANTHLMLNLQTIAETLNTKCQGRSWVFVTSQEDMDKVLGDRTKEQGNDFSKIQARFKTRLKLTSADVEEVIRRRLLEKNDVGTAALRDIYVAESANFRTLFDFVDGAKTYRNYTDEDHFVGTYPFVSYQFPLFQAAIEGISDHNVFEGRNSSVGERSMLGVVQQVAKEIGDVEVGRLATFDQLFAGIRAALKSAAQRSIDVAERNLDNPLAVRLLKALFLVKYVESFQATPRNLTVLMYEGFGGDLADLSSKVRDALTLLETQTYVRRNGNVYEYLTNEEKAIEEEIKNVEVDASEVSARLMKILTGDVIKTSKLRYGKNGQDFPFGFKLDDQLHGTQRELSIHFITPDSPYTEGEIRMQSAGRDELRVVFDRNDPALSDLPLLIKTEKYVKRKQTASLPASQDLILRSKAAQNLDREKELVARIRRAVGQAQLIINGADVPSSAQDPLARVTEGFQDLIGRTYTHLKLLGGVNYGEEQIAGAANPESGLFEALGPSAEEVLSFVMRTEARGEQVSVKRIVDAFQAKPYGWGLASIEVVIATLIGASKLTLTVDGNVLKRTEIAPALRNTQKHPHEVISLQRAFDERKVAGFRRFCVEFFDDASVPSDPLELARHAAAGLTDKHAELVAMANDTRYPFVGQLDVPIGLLAQTVGNTEDWFLTDFDLADDLLDAKENVVDPIQAFLAGPQRAIYDATATFLAAQSSNLSYLVDGAADAVREAIADPNIFRGSRMAQLKRAAEGLQGQIDAVLAATRSEVSAAIEVRKAELVGGDFYAVAAPTAKEDVVARVDSLLRRIATESEIALIRQMGAGFRDRDYPELLDLLEASRPDASDDDPPPKQTVSIRTIAVSTTVAVLEDDADVDVYVNDLRRALIQTLLDGKRISL